MLKNIGFDLTLPATDLITATHCCFASTICHAFDKQAQALNLANKFKQHIVTTLPSHWPGDHTPAVISTICPRTQHAKPT